MNQVKTNKRMLRKKAKTKTRTPTDKQKSISSLKYK